MIGTIKRTSVRIPGVRRLLRCLEGFPDAAVTDLPFPPVINSESTNLCDARCVMCPSTSSTRQKGTMDFELFRKIADECAGRNIKYFGLHLFGEPLMDKLLFKKIEYARTKDIRNIGFFTNASLLDEEKAARVIELEVDHVTVSFDGATKATYESIRTGLDFDAVSANVRKLMELRKKSKKIKPHVNMVFTRQRKNAHEEQLFIRLWKTAVDSVSVCDAHTWGELVTVAGAGAIHKTGGRKRPPCSRLWLNPAILYTGEVALCCVDFNAEVILGNVRRDPIIDVWNSEKLIALRRKHQDGRFSEIRPCRDCIAWKWMNPWWW